MMRSRCGWFYSTTQLGFRKIWQRWKHKSYSDVKWFLLIYESNKLPLFFLREKICSEWAFSCWYVTRCPRANAFNVNIRPILQNLSTIISETIIFTQIVKWKMENSNNWMENAAIIKIITIIVLPTAKLAYSPISCPIYHLSVAGSILIPHSTPSPQRYMNQRISQNVIFVFKIISTYILYF